jgi:hypothetical protein
MQTTQPEAEGQALVVELPATQELGTFQSLNIRLCILMCPASIELGDILSERGSSGIPHTVPNSVTGTIYLLHTPSSHILFFHFFL